MLFLYMTISTFSYSKLKKNAAYEGKLSSISEENLLSK